MDGLAGKASRALRSVVTAPPFAGALVVSALAAFAGRPSREIDLAPDVRRDEAVETFIAQRFASEIAQMKIGVAATAIALGLVVGLVAEVLQRLRHSERTLAKQRPILKFVESALLCLFVHGAIVLWAMADSPQLYAARWYAQGGLARTVQICATDVLGTRGVVLAVIGLALLYVRPPRKIAIATATIAVAVAAAETMGEPEARATPSSHASLARRPNVLLVAASSLRADRIDPRVAPALTALANEGTKFERAYVSIPRTVPSWVTILTGRHAHAHGIRTTFPTWDERAKDFDALPQRLARAGYETGVVSDAAGDVFGKIALGFDTIDAPSLDLRQLARQRALERETALLPLLHSQLGRWIFPAMNAIDVAADPSVVADDVEVAIAAMKRKDKPFFLTVFFSASRAPYTAPAPYYAKYTDPSYRGRYKYHVDLGGDAAPDEADVRQVRALYDGAVSAIDDAVGRILRALDRAGLARDTVVVVTADHGEALFEHGRGRGHGDHLLGDEAVHVPLLVYDPRAGKGGLREERVVRDVDVAATLYELAGVEAPPDLDGRSVAPALRGEPIEPRLAYAEAEPWLTEASQALDPSLRVPHPGVTGLTEIDAARAQIVMREDMNAVTRTARHRMVRDERWKLVYAPTRQGVKYMLFDTRADPGEQRDVASEHAGELARLRSDLWAWMLRDASMEQKDGFLVPRVGP
ncbi:MAG: sulfatase-like hydrolase/transferase [Labilithrix sp.]|nr:sulfatase-like hydrolase/transferase [Labilithrix sp.]